MSKKIFYLTALVLVFLASCEQYSCQRSVGMRLAFVSFTEAETDTVIVRRFAKGTDFNQLIDTALVDTALVKYSNRGDTLFPVELHVETLLASLYDYQVSIPEVNRTFAITEITEEERKMKDGFLSSSREVCYNPVRAYTLNGERKTVIPNHEVIYLDN